MSAHVAEWNQYSRKQIEDAIHAACLGDIDEYIAKRYLIGRIPHIEIAGELMAAHGITMDRCTVTRHWRAMENRIKQKIPPG